MIATTIISSISVKPRWIILTKLPTRKSKVPPIELEANAAMILRIRLLQYVTSLHWHLTRIGLVNRPWDPGRRFVLRSAWPGFFQRFGDDRISRSIPVLQIDVHVFLQYRQNLADFGVW